MFCKLELFLSLLITPSLPTLWFESPREKQNQRNERSNQRECLGNTYELPRLLFILLTLLSWWGLPRPQVGDAQGMVRCLGTMTSVYYLLSSQAIRVTLDLSLFCHSCPLGHKWFGITKHWSQHLFTYFGLCLRPRALTLVHKTLMYQSTKHWDARQSPTSSISSRCRDFKVFPILPNPFAYNLRFRHKMTDFLVHGGILDTESLFKEKVSGTTRTRTTRLLLPLWWCGRKAE